ncbi:hypothetical protein SO802_030621 [Lithocarpus litseifolius]|uniref:Uncharacterized protein n=1 Tax=Lithocarpus litseifolius TaxID=425828 RepID=A0AAW2BI22_9ROSI
MGATDRRCWSGGLLMAIRLAQALVVHWVMDSRLAQALVVHWVMDSRWSDLFFDGYPENKRWIGRGRGQGMGRYDIFGRTVSPACCEGIKAFNSASNTTQDHRAACSSIMDGLSKFLGINYELVGTLPETYGTTCPYKITPTTNCSK